MMLFAMTSPTPLFSTDVSGRGPYAQAVRNWPGAVAEIDVMFATAAVAPGRPVLTVSVLPAAGIAPVRVFNTRSGFGVTSPAGPVFALIGDQATANGLPLRSRSP